MADVSAWRKLTKKKTLGNKAVLTQIKHISQYPMTHLSTNPKLLKSLPSFWWEEELRATILWEHHYVRVCFHEIRPNLWIHFEEVVRSVNPK